jgi:hypothetical protein
MNVIETGYSDSHKRRTLTIEEAVHQQSDGSSYESEDYAGRIQARLNNTNAMLGRLLNVLHAAKLLDNDAVLMVLGGDYIAEETL